ncbi:MAG: Na+/H+ antiporter NhaA [Rhodospirillaceae bacterium]|nr:Na+/H+ antiporter NhaA [Rhodospirillales bacterium]
MDIKGGLAAKFLALESAGGILLVGMMVVALAVVNSPLGPLYDAVLNWHLGPLSLLHWINDGLMAVFFLLVALEIKREMLDGELSSRAQIMLPAVAAVGGMMVPALVYLGVNGANPEGWRGWAIPSATDIAFSLGVLSVLGKRVPMSLRVFLTALAIIDDLGAILIIAFFYSGALSPLYLAGGAAAAVVLAILNRAGVVRLLPYLLVGAVLWVCMLKSGIHATIAGVVLGLAIPLPALHRLEHGLHPWVAFLILPLFALANSGLSFQGLGLDAVRNPVFLGIAAGLFVGKQIGVFGFSWALIRLGWGRLPEGAGWRSFYGVSVLTGIGFTMSLFIGGLAFPDGGAMVETRFGVLVGSLLSALVGYALLARRPLP